MGITISLAHSTLDPSSTPREPYMHAAIRRNDIGIHIASTSMCPSTILRLGDHGSVGLRPCQRALEKPPLISRELGTIPRPLGSQASSQPTELAPLPMPREHKKTKH